MTKRSLPQACITVQKYVSLGDMAERSRSGGGTWVRLRDFDAEVIRLTTENEILRRGMKGDYDLDAWLDWAAHKDTAITLLNLAENMLAEESLVSPGDTSVPNTQDDRDEMRKRIVDYLRTLPCGTST